MRSSGPDGAPRGVSHDSISRRRLLAAGGAVAAGSLAGCLNRVASSLTNTGSSPAAVFAGVDWNDDDTEVTLSTRGESLSGPHVARLTPTLAGRVELEGWVTSSVVVAQNHNSSRSNRTQPLARDDGDSDGDGVADADEDDELVAYLDGEPIVGERFAVCLPDAEVPGGNGSIEDAVTPERLIGYLTGRSGGEGRLYSWGSAKAGPGDPDPSTDCDDTDDDVYPGAVCGTTPHFVAEVSGPTATGGGLVAERAADGHVVVTNSPPSAEGGASVVVCPAEDEPFEPEGLGAWAQRAESPPSTMAHQGRLLDLTVVQVTVRPPGCPRAFPALLYVSRGPSDGQLVYSGGWVIDDAAVYENSTTALTTAGSAKVVGIECCFDFDSDGDGFSDELTRAGLSKRERRGARITSGVVEELVESGAVASSTAEEIRKRPGRRRDGESRGEVTGDEYGFVTHVPVDPPVLHLVNAASASNEVKFKTGAELSKSVN